MPPNRGSGKDLPRFADIYEQVARLGLWGFPISSDGEKKPCIGWTQIQDRPASREELADFAKRFPYAGVGIPTGRATGIIVIDADNDQAIAWLQARGAPNTWTVLMRRGAHFYFSHPTFDVRDCTSKLAEHVDVRGRGGFVVSAGSLGRDGFADVWAAGLSPAGTGASTFAAEDSCTACRAQGRRF
jgi:Bifunctional DNA primase/polymerase, N-terminal